MIYPTLSIEKDLWKQKYQYVCGVDEVGRGCFAGPVAAGAVVFPENVNLPKGLNDSKLLSPRKREELSGLIKQISLAWFVALVDVDYIDKYGIGKATQKAFIDAINGLKIIPDFVLIDAFQINNFPQSRQMAIIGGDRLSVSISAASIIAKVYRDQIMCELSPQYPQYKLEKNKGYGTLDHRLAIKTNGLSDIHRASFNLSKFT